jgi:class 3 adenylate cyclase
MVTLNAFLEKAGVCIGEAGGAIDKYVPDGVVAHFGIAEHLTSQARNCPSSTELRALQAALSILEVADAMNAQRAARKTSSLVVGVRVRPLLLSGPARAYNQSFF